MRTVWPVASSTNFTQLIDPSASLAVTESVTLWPTTGEAGELAIAPIVGF